MQLADSTVSMSFSDVRRHALANRLTDAAARLDKAVSILTPNPKDPKAPKLAWGNDLGLFELLDRSANVLDLGRDGLSSMFTRRQAGRLFDALQGDVAHVSALRDAALAIDEGLALGKLGSPAPTFGCDAVRMLTRASQDARTAVLLLVPKA